jgi:DNA-binding NarL/FixJ family response regulator
MESLLIIDSDQKQGSVYEQMLQKAFSTFVKIYRCSTLEGGLTKARATHPQCVIMNVAMAGDDLSEYLRQFSAPVVCISTERMPGTLAESQGAFLISAQDVVSNPQSLPDAVKRAIHETAQLRGGLRETDEVVERLVRDIEHLSRVLTQALEEVQARLTVVEQTLARHVDLLDGPRGEPGLVKNVQLNTRFREDIEQMIRTMSWRVAKASVLSGGAVAGVVTALLHIFR